MGYPLAIMDREKVRIWYPDFRLPEYGTIIEYFGMNGNDAYNEQIVERIEGKLEDKLRKIRSVNQAMYAAQVRA